MAQQNLVRFSSWDDVLKAAAAGEQLWYEAPMDAAQAYPAKQVVVRKVYKNGKLRIDPVSNQTDPFIADSGHLYRFRHRPSPPVAREYVASDLVPYANLSTGQCCSLKLDAGEHRVWLCRVGGGVTVERLVSGRWERFDGGCHARFAKAP